MGAHCVLTRDLAGLKNESPILQLRVRVGWSNLEKYLDIYDTKFLPVDHAVDRVPLRFLHETRHHFNLTFLYHYQTWDAWRGFYDIYVDKWMEINRLAEARLAREAIDQVQGQLNDMVEDDERLILLGFDQNSWPGGGGQTVAV